MKNSRFLRCIKGFFVTGAVLLLLSLGCVGVSAQDIPLETMPQAYQELQDAIPPDAVELLPDGLFSEDPQEALRAVEEMSTPTYLLRVVLDMTGLYGGAVVQTLVVLLGLLLLSALLKHLQEAWGKGGEGFSFCLRMCMYALMVAKAGEMLAWVSTYFERLQTLMNSMIPVMGVLYAMGGNVGQATIGSEMVLLLMGVCEYITTSVTPALCGICLAFALMEAFGGGTQLKLSPISGLCKKWYTSLLGFLMFLMTAALSVQSLLAVKADTLTMRGVKYAVGQMIPVVGGAVSGTLGSVAAGVGLLRSVAGVSGLLLLTLLLLPTLLQLLLFRGCYQLAAGIGSMLSCDGEAKLLGEIGSLYGYMAAAVSICAVGFIVVLAIFAYGATAMGMG